MRFAGAVAGHADVQVRAKARLRRPVGIDGIGGAAASAGSSLSDVVFLCTRGVERWAGAAGPGERIALQISALCFGHVTHRKLSRQLAVQAGR
jgi:hypothetical protein